VTPRARGATPASCALAAAFALALGAPSCAKSPRVETRAVTLHVPRDCAPGDAPYGLFYAAGDFDPTTLAPSLPLASVGAVLAGMPAATRSLVVDAIDAQQAEWRAFGDVAPGGGGDVDLLLLPYRAPCALSPVIDGRTDAALGAIDARRAILAGGRATASGVPTTQLFDLTLGTARTLLGLLVPRARATITSFGEGGLVAGGADPDTGDARATAEVFAGQDFDGNPIALSEPRTDHGAAVLATGETLLVGGSGPRGVLRSMEAVDPVTRRARTSGLAALAVARSRPQVLRLASGEILVAGGLDAEGVPVPTLEWFTADARAASRRPRDLVAGIARGFAALPAGGALAVIAPDAPTPGFQNVWVIAADGALEAAVPIDGALGAVRLFAGSTGAPVLWTGDRWLVWSPWAGAFAPLAGAEGAGGPPDDTFASADPGLAMWTDGARLLTLRFATRGAYASTPASRPLLALDTAFTAPDRLVSADPRVASPIRFDATLGLTLEGDATVFVADATYATVRIDLTLPTGASPRVVLRDEAGVEAVVDAASCALGAAAPGASLAVVREGAGVRAALDGADLHECAVTTGPTARLSVGLRGPVDGGTAVARSLVLSRGAP
jgi:hypothetical protein